MDIKKQAINAYIVIVLTVVGIFALASAIVISYPALAYIASKFTM